ncbi:hypothetical protein AFB00_12710 [Pseudonocardia sp. HH130630-07]|nr:hypothetical protein AFB00_12710 [Pseudonocardia sp. HH130630-07]
MRADAERNRRQILRAAQDLFGRVGPAVPMEEIARAAGVGVATLYRRFPDRDRLIEAVSHDLLERLVEMARRVERDEPDPAVALATLLRSALDLRLSVLLSVASTRVYQQVRDAPATREGRGEVIATAERLLRRAQAAGSVRADIGIGDAILPLVLVSQVDTGSAGTDPTVLDRLFALVMDGLRTGPGQPLPGPPLGFDAIGLGRRAPGAGPGEAPAPVDHAGRT